MQITCSPSLSATWSAVRRRLSLHMLLFVTSLALVISLCYIATTTTLPNEPDLCHVFQENDQVLQRVNRTKAWWEWACMIERELDVGERYRCSDRRMMGNYPVCFDSPYGPQPPCLVYSFGIDNDFEFDDAMAAQGCDVFSFDPSMGVSDYQHAPRVTFKALGLATRDSDSYQPNLDVYVSDIVQWKVRTLSSIRKMLGHEQRTIDILKIDVESYEWRVMRQLLTSGHLQRVRQLLIEWHIFPNEPFRHHFAHMFQTIKDLHDIGFTQFYIDHVSRHHRMSHFLSQAETGWVNTKFSSVEKTERNGGK